VLKGRDLLTLAELSSEEVWRVFELTRYLKEGFEGADRLLHGRTLAMIFQKPSTRTRTSFEVAMYQLGGHAINLSASELQLARGETIEDTARTLSRYVDAIMARVYGHQDVERLAAAADVPVINGLSDLYHPCQTLADLYTILEVKGRLKGVRIAWVGDGNNVCNSLMIGAGKVGAEMVVATPSGYRPHPEALEWAREAAARTGGSIRLVEDPVEAVEDADVVVTDVFVSMGFDEEREARLQVFLPRYQVRPELLAHARKDAIFLHPLPAHRGEEVVDEVIDGPHSRVWDQAENRLHTQKAVLCLLLLGEEALASRIGW
jgi:ornithine carbamoyltransferase